MQKDEIRRLIEVSANQSVCLGVQFAPQFPGYVRSIFIRPGNRVCVDYEPYGLDEGGVYYEGVYESLDAAITHLERFLGCPMLDWKDQSSFYPEKDRSVDIHAGHLALKTAIRSGSVPLPEGTRFILKGDSYWTRFLP